MTARAICAYVGEPENCMGRLVRKEGLPAWKTKGKSMWKAKVDDLDQWLEEQKLRHIRKTLSST